MTDLGTHSTESTDYPDFAQTVAQDVLEQKAIWACWSAPRASDEHCREQSAGNSRRAGFQRGMAAWRASTTMPMSSAWAQKVTARDRQENCRCFSGAHFEGGRHERRVKKIENIRPQDLRLNAVDPEIATPFFWKSSASRKTSN